MKIHLKALFLLISATFLLSACITNRSFKAGADDIAGDVGLKARLLRDRQYNYNDVDLTIFEGRMLLTGTMRNLEGKNYLTEISRKIPNITEVLNEVQIGPKTSFRQGASDAILDQRAVAALVRDPTVITANYGIAVSNSIVYIVGVAQGPGELKRATDHARRIPGVNRVVSHIIYVDDPRRQQRRN